MAKTGNGGGVRLITGPGVGGTGDADEPSPGMGFSGKAPTNIAGSPITASPDLSFNLTPSGVTAFRKALTSETAGSFADRDGMMASGTVDEGAAPGAERLEEAGNATDGALCAAFDALASSSFSVVERGLRRIVGTESTASAAGTVADGT